LEHYVRQHLNTMSPEWFPDGICLHGYTSERRRRELDQAETMATFKTDLIRSVKTVQPCSCCCHR
jgi:hypothetical protein